MASAFQCSPTIEELASGRTRLADLRTAYERLRAEGRTLEDVQAVLAAIDECTDACMGLVRQIFAEEDGAAALPSGLPGGLARQLRRLAVLRARTLALCIPEPDPTDR